jgi:hypothetical protein
MQVLRGRNSHEGWPQPQLKKLSSCSRGGGGGGLGGFECSPSGGPLNIEQELHEMQYQQQQQQVQVREGREQEGEGRGGRQ